MKTKNKVYLYAAISLAVIAITLLAMNGQKLNLPGNLTGHIGGVSTKSETSQPVTRNNPSAANSNYSCTVEIFTSVEGKLEKGNNPVKTADYTLKLYNRNNLLRLDLPYLGDAGTRIYADTASNMVTLYSDYTKSTYTDGNWGPDYLIPPKADTGKEIGRESITQGKETIACILKNYQTPYGTTMVYYNETTLLPVKAVFEGGKDNPPVEMLYTGYQIGKVSENTVTCPK